MNCQMCLKPIGESDVAIYCDDCGGVFCHESCERRHDCRDENDAFGREGCGVVWREVEAD